MTNVDYIKEQLNTLRIEFMAHILVLIALGSGLSKMYLTGAELGFLNLYTFGIIILNITIINAIYKLHKLYSLVERLNNDRDDSIR